jgi:NADPH:quinone reductase-like Zn-dependent oxidoreductase
MRAVRVRAYDEPPATDDIEMPGAPDSGQLAIEVAAVGVGSWDVGVATGRLARFVDLEPPFVMGAELAGRIAEVGPDAEGFAVGDRIIANPGIVGAWAARVNIAADTCGPAPAALDDVQAAAIPVGAVAALQSLELLALAPGASLLILGAGGSVGQAAIQLARARGLSVHVLVRTGDVERSRELGAEAALDQAGDWIGQLAGPVDGVLDLIGGEQLERSAAVLHSDGRAVTTLAESMRSLVASRISLRYLRMRSTTRDLAVVSAHVDAGDLSLPVGVVLPVEEVRAALDGLEESVDRGKHVLEF